MAKLSSFIFILVNFVLVGARVDMTFFSTSAKITETTETQKILIFCLDAPDADGDIEQEFGRVVDTGTGTTGTGASGPSNYGSGGGSVAVGSDSGLPLGSLISNNNGHLGHMLDMPSSSSILVERVGVFYCDTTRSTDEGDDETRIQHILLAENAVIKPLRLTVTIMPGETATLDVETTSDSSSGLKWLLHGGLTNPSSCDDHSSCDVSEAGIYECYYEGQRDLGLHGIMRVIVRGCPAEMWDPASGCDKVCVECINGGVCDDQIGDCICPPGFHGAHCEETCGFNAVGPTCGIACSGNIGCRERYLCLPDPYGCTCTAGYQGEICETACDGDHFGADCALDCHCASGGCDKYTGECGNNVACATGWSGYNCQYISPIVVSFTNVKVNSGEQTIFTCVIEAYPRPLESQIIIAISSSPSLDISLGYTVNLDNRQVTVTSNSVTVSSGEVYICVVTSSAVAGSVTETITVDLFMAPSLVNGPTTDLGSTQVTVSWTSWTQDTDSGDGPVSMYRVYYKLATQPDFALFGETTGTSLAVTGLDDNTTYQFAVTAHRETTGWGDFSPVTQATTLCSVPGPVPILDFTDTTANSVQLTWQQPTGTNCVVNEYEIEYELINGDMCQISGVTGTTKVEGSSSSFNYNELEPYSEYTMKVAPITDGGTGDQMYLNITTEESVPSSGPREVEGVSSELGSITFRWKPVECGQRRGSILSYNYQLDNENTSTIVYSDSLPVETEERVFDDLDSNHLYGFKIRAATSNGSGIYSVVNHISPDGTDEGADNLNSPALLSPGIIVAIVVVLVVLLVVSFILVVIFYRRRLKESKDPVSYHDNETDIHNATTILSPVETGYRNSTKPQSSVKTNSAFNNYDDFKENYNNTHSQQPVYENIVPPIKITNLAKHIQKKRQSNDGFSSEFKSIPPGAQKEWTVAKMPQNKKKNRYGNIVPYDDSRVVLLSLKGKDDCSDYINASYINGYNKANAFIASQGPNKETINDFWKMIWQENTATILMATKCVEAGKIKCEQYWPTDGAVDYDGIIVNYLEKESTADYIIHTFHISSQRDDHKKMRVVKHFQFLVWPDMGVPVYTAPVILFLRRVRTSNPPNAGPIVIHCSAGVGRTGTFIAICNMLDMKDDLQEVGVHGCVHRLREQRVNMVQTQEQYEFIYNTLLEVVLCGNTSIATSNFSDHLAKLKTFNQGTRKSGIEVEFENLEKLSPVPSASDCKTASNNINRSKNRYPKVLAIDRTRPRLMTTDSESSDYINANFVDGYSQRNAFMVTQMPLPNTVADFWSMVSDYYSYTIVMLNDLDPRNGSLVQYWPNEEGQSLSFGSISVTLTSESEWKGITLRDFAIQNESRSDEELYTVRQFQVGDVNLKSDRSFDLLLDLMTAVEKWQQQTGNRPITVQCINGLGLSGVYCAITSICERAKVEQYIDVFQTVKNMRVCRTGMVETLDQYTMCYDVSMRYLASFETYANFQ